ncbi:hypothetical protein [Paractinoplanes maris]|uniref:hypothetical protein n=1 Tax=Paractinoplanes maris TaxID=1734446 RepID=UPI002022409F|nr:hypothetical protein [Actinoplanes maris]
MAETTGLCVGGPLDGQRITVRTPAGFLAVDKAESKAWMYQRQQDGTYAVCTDHDDSLLYPQGARTGERRFDEDRAWQAAEGSELDVIAVGR